MGETLQKNVIFERPVTLKVNAMCFDLFSPYQMSPNLCLHVMHVINYFFFIWWSKSDLKIFDLGSIIFKI